MNFVVRPLADGDDFSPFDCGVEQLNLWLRAHAPTARGQGTRTYVVEGDGKVIGYFAVAPHTVDRADMSKSVGRGAPRQIPAVLLAKLALDRSVHGDGLGSELLVVALGRIIAAARMVGGKLVVVDAIDSSAAAFYAHHDFLTIPENPLRLVQKLSTVAKALDQPWP